MVEQKQIARPCEICGNAFVPQIGNLRVGWGRRCSRTCAAKKGTLEQRFWSHVNVKRGCWLWTRQTYNGCAYLAVGKGEYGTKMIKAARMAWTLMRGPIPEGLCVLHHCDNPMCMNPEHLWLGTFADNSRDMRLKGRGRTKLTQDDVQAIRNIPGTHREIAKQFGVSHRMIGDIINNKWWRHIP